MTGDAKSSHQSATLSSTKLRTTKSPSPSTRALNYLLRAQKRDRETKKPDEHLPAPHCAISQFLQAAVCTASTQKYKASTSDRSISRNTSASGNARSPSRPTRCACLLLCLVHYHSRRSASPKRHS